MKKLTITLLVGLLAPGFALAADTSLEIVSRHKAVFSTPPKKIPSVSSVDAPLLGNGDTLVALGGNAANLRFYIGKNELWVMSTSQGTKPLPLARLDLDLPAMEGATYRVEQDLATAITTGQFTKDGKELTLETGVSATENLLWAKLSVTGGSLEGSAKLFEVGGISAGKLSDPGGPVHVGREMLGAGRWYFDGEIAGLRVVPEVLPGKVVGKPENPENFDGKTTSRTMDVPKMERTVSVASWIRLRSAHAQANYIVSKGEWNRGYSLGVSNGKLRFSVGSASAQTQDALPLNEWLYVVASFDGDAMRVFVNGELKAGPPEGSGSLAAPKDVQMVRRHFTGDDPESYRGLIHNISIPAGAACAVRVLGSDSTFTVTPEQPVILVAAVSGLHGDGDDYTAKAVKRASAFNAKDLPKIKADHIAWWRDFWNRSFVEIPDPQLEQRYYLSHYGMASCSRVADFPPGLFGWVTTNNPAWFGDYHMNYNFVSPFYGLYAANHLEQAAPCNEPILANLEQAKKWSLERTGVEGTLQSVGIGPLGSVAYLTDHGQKSNSSYSCVPLAKYWYASYDKDYGKRAYPFVSATALFWENWLKFEDGRYVLYGCAAHEGSGNDMNGIASLGLIRMVLNLALDMSTELGVDAERHEKWKHILAHLSAFPTQERPGNTTIFRYTEKGIPWYKSNTIGIQHIYPAGAIGLDSPPELLELSRNTIEAMNRWIDMNGMNSFYPAAARVGYDPGIILAKLKDMLTRIGGPNGMEPGNPHAVEIFSIVPNTIQEMLMQSHEGVIRFFPNWPGKTDARFGTLRARGAFLISAARKDGEVTGVEILSEKGRDCTVQNPWPEKKVKVTRNGKPAETVSGERFTLKTAAGEQISLAPQP